ncbi:UNVERIFIED_CONTAM: Zinc finger BED domain-containing protein RICESLEEPER 4, partial [Sesamum latifolium]
MDQSELDIYLHEEIVNDSPTFDIIDWWKSHSPKFPMLSRLTRDVLAMPISTMATESAFSIGGCIINNFLASLPPKMAQALICCQDWLHHTPIKPMEEDRDFIQKIEK